MDVKVGWKGLLEIVGKAMGQDVAMSRRWSIIL